MVKTAEIVKASEFSYFVFYREDVFLYRTEKGFEFIIPLEDIGKATLLPKEKSLILMRWIRKQVEMINGLKIREND